MFDLLIPRKPSPRELDEAIYLALQQARGVFALPGATAVHVAAELGRQIPPLDVGAKAAGRSLSRLGCVMWQPRVLTYPRSVYRPRYHLWDPEAAYAMGHRELHHRLRLVELKTLGRRLEFPFAPNHTPAQKVGRLYRQDPA